MCQLTRGFDGLTYCMRNVMEFKIKKNIESLPNQLLYNCRSLGGK